jgi:hypothetical protein
MDNESDTAARYLKRAEQVRAIADGVKSDSARKILIRIAADYERMARTVAEIEKTERNFADRNSKNRQS